MPNLQASPRNEILGYLADLLQSGKSTANQYEVLPQVPLIGGTGLGDLFMGKAPELFDDMSYYGLQAAMRGSGINTLGAKPAVADAILLGMDLVGLGKGLGSLSKKSATAVYDKLINGTTSLSRREALKKIGGISGGAAVTGGGVGLLRKFADKAAVDAAPKVADNVISHKNYRFNTLADYLDNVKMKAQDEAFIEHAENGGLWGEDVQEQSIRKWINHFLKNDEANYTNAKNIASNYLKLDPKSMHPSPILDAFSPQAKQEMNIFKKGVDTLNSHYGLHDIDAWTDWAHNSDDINETLKFLQNYLDAFSPQAKQEMNEFKSQLRQIDRERFLGEESMMNHPDEMAEIAHEFDTYQKQHSAFDTQNLDPMDFYLSITSKDLPF